MALTRTIPLKNGKYVVEFLSKRYFNLSLERILKYYCRNSRSYQATFELDYGGRHFTISVDHLLYGPMNSSDLEFYLMGNNLTGVVVEDMEEACAIEDIVEKVHVWALLKE